MAIDDTVRDEKLLFDINSTAAKISALSFGKSYKYEYLVSEFYVFFFRKSFSKTNKNN